MATIYGIQNGELTTSKTCNRKAILDAIEADGFAWGVALDGKLQVVNKSRELAEAWDNYWGETGQVVKVYAGKKAAEAACEPAEVEPAEVEPGYELRMKDIEVGYRVITKDGIEGTCVDRTINADSGWTCMGIKYDDGRAETYYGHATKTLPLAYGDGKVVDIDKVLAVAARRRRIAGI